MTWAELVLPATTMLLLSILPGMLMLLAVGLRGLLAVGAGPALTISAAGVLGIVLDLIGIPYTLLTQLLGMAVFVGLAAGLGHLLGTAPWVRPERARQVVQPVPLSRLLTSVLLGLVVVGTAVHCLGLARGMVAPDQPVQTWDGVYHLGAIRTIQDTGNASVLGGMAPMYDALDSVFYPAVWHGFVAVAPGFDLPSTAANASSFVMGPIWMLSSAALARVAWPQRPLAAVVAPLIAASFITTPLVLLGVVSLWPYAAAHVGVPGLLAVVALAIRQLPHARPTAALAIPAFIGFVGAALTHGSAAFSLIVLVTPLVAVGIYRACRHAWRSGHRRPVLITLGVLAALLVIGIVGLSVFPVLDMVMGFERGGQDSYLPVIGQLLIDNPMVYSYDWTASAGQVTVTVLTVVGAVVAYRLRSGRWIVLGWACALVLTALTSGPEDNPLRALAGFWYTQPSRVVVLVGIMAVPLASLGVATLARVIAGWWAGRTGVELAPDGADDADPGTVDLGAGTPDPSPAVGPDRGHAVGPDRATVLDPDVPHDRGHSTSPRPVIAGAVLVLGLIVLVTGGLRVDLRSEIITNTYVPGRIAWGTMLTEEEIDLVTRAGDVLPDDALVLGDPFSGAAYLYSMGGVEVVYRQLGQWDTEELITLGTSFDQIYTDPEICRIVRDLGITHVVTDTATRGPYEDQQKFSYRTEGLAYVRPAEGFELVDRAGETSIWRLTYCEDEAAPAAATG